jgi:DNA-binding response OmpR family regulator
MNSKPHLLLIDDNSLWLDTLADYFRDEGFVVHTATNAAYGLRLMERDDIGLALVDGHMPDMDGVELLRRARQRRLAVEVLLVSGDDDPALEAQALAEGAKGFLPKASSSRLFLRAVCQVLGERGAMGHEGVPSSWRRLLPVLRRNISYLPVPVFEKD